MSKFDLESYMVNYNSSEVCFGLVLNGFNCKIKNISGAFEQLTGFMPNEFIDNNNELLLGICPEKEVTRLRYAIDYYIKYLNSFPIETKSKLKLNFRLDFVKKNASKIHLQLQFIPIINEDDLSLKCYLIIVSEVSQIKTKLNNYSYILDCRKHDNIQKIAINPFEGKRIKTVISLSEKRILKLMSEGFSSKMIANTLNISIHTVKNHRKSMLFKSECKTSSELIKRAIVEGWI